MNKILKTFLLSVSVALTLEANAQSSYLTYNHDDTKMNQVTVQEIGAGSLTPEFYYTIFHNSYKETAASKNKASFRSLASISAYQQVEDADSIKTVLKKRAEIEALNMTDRQIDLAWQTEGSKITSKLTDFEKNIGRIVGAGGSAQDKERWNEYYHIFECAIKSTQDAYMPNSQRKKEYLAIYSDIVKQNDLLISYLVQLSKKTKTSRMLAASNILTDNRASIASAAHSRWREAGWRTMKAHNDSQTGNESNGSTSLRQE